MQLQQLKERNGKRHRKHKYHNDFVGVFEFIFKIARPCTCEDLLTAQGSEMCSTRFVHCIHERACAQA